MEEKVKAFLELATQKKASDIFIIAGRPLSVKIDGKLCTLEGFEERLMPPETDEFIRIIYKLAHGRNIEPMLETGDDDFSMAIPWSLPIPCKYIPAAWFSCCCHPYYCI